MEGLEISQLPEDIIHHILSYFETREAGQASLFCKAWYRAWLTCPTLNFVGGYCCGVEECLKFTGNTLQRYKERKIGIVELTMPVAIRGFCSASIIDEWVGIAVQNGVKRLFCESLVYGQIQPQNLYALPRKIFEAKTLRELKLEGPNMLWSDHKVMLNNLQALHLSYIHINDDMFQGIIERCPLIDDLLIKDCVGLVRIKVKNLNNLKKFNVQCTRGNESVEIEAPYLRYLYCFMAQYGCSIDLCRTRALKFLSLDCNLPSTAAFFDNFEQEFPQVEDLRLNSCHGLTKIDISSHSLKSLKLKGIRGLREVKINAPSLQSFEICLAGIASFPDVSLTNVSSQLESKIFKGYWLCTSDQLSKMMGFLANLLPSKILLFLRFIPVSVFDDVMNIPSCPVLEVADLHLHYGRDNWLSSSKLSSFLDALFMTCHPKTIALRNHHYEALNILHQDLVARRNQGLKEVTLDDQTKVDMWHCWQYDRSEVEWLFGEAEYNWSRGLLDCSEFFGHTARYKLEWEAY